MGIRSCGGKAHFSARFLTRAKLNKFLDNRIFLDSAPKSVVLFPHPVLMRRGVRAIVTIRGAGMRWPRPVRRFCATTDEVRTVKSCGPGLPMLRSSRRCDERADDGGKKAGPRGDHV